MRDEREVLDVHYRRAEGAVERRLQPLACVKAGVWYLVARSGIRPRTYRVPTSSILA